MGGHAFFDDVGRHPEVAHHADLEQRLKPADRVVGQQRLLLALTGVQRRSVGVVVAKPSDQGDRVLGRAVRDGSMSAIAASDRGLHGPCGAWMAL